MSGDLDADPKEVDNAIANQDQHVVEYHDKIESDEETRKGKWIRGHNSATTWRDYTSSS